jgi:hypothetical protein
MLDILHPTVLWKSDFHASNGENAIAQHYNPSVDMYHHLRQYGMYTHLDDGYE